MVMMMECANCSFLQAMAASGGGQAAYVRKETQYAWECIQKECQKVLALLLHGQAPGAASAGGAFSKGDALHPIALFL